MWGKGIYNSLEDTNQLHLFSFMKNLWYIQKNKITQSELHYDEDLYSGSILVYAICMLVYSAYGQTGQTL